MLVNRPSVSIFQQIILPYIVSARQPIHIHSQRYFSSSSSATRPHEATEGHRRESTWELYPAEGSRRRTREYLGLGVDGTPDSPGSSSGSGSGSGSGSRASARGAEVDEEEAYKRTAALAMERMIQSHQPLRSGIGGFTGNEVRIQTSGKGKGKAMVEDNLPDDKCTGPKLGSGPKGKDAITGQALASSTDSGTSPTKILSTTTITPTPADPSISTTSKKPFPRLIFKLLQARHFRLAALYILNLPTYAMNESLVENVAGYMVRHGGGRAAARLRRGNIPSPEERALMSDHEGEQLPVNYWNILRSSRPPPRTLDDVTRFMPGIDLTKTQKFTAFCNLQLAHFLSTDSPKGVIPPKSFRKPNSSLRQLSELLSRIHRLEHHRGFIPDRVTANIILSCWLQCSLTPPPSGARIAHTKSGWKIHYKTTSKAQGTFGKEELRRIFDLISRLINRSISSKDQSLNYERHVQPFVRMLSRGFEDLGDEQGWQKVKEWDMVVKNVLLDPLWLEQSAVGRDDGAEKAKTK